MRMRNPWMTTVSHVNWPASLRLSMRTRQGSVKMRASPQADPAYRMIVPTEGKKQATKAHISDKAALKTTTWTTDGQMEAKNACIT